MDLRPGFTGNTLDRADRVRHQPELLEAALADAGARLLVLDGLDPILDEDGRLTWTDLAEAQGELLFLGYDQGVPRFVSALPDDMPVPMGRSLAMFALLDRFAAPDAANYAAARSLVFWHGRHRFCANCGSPTRISHAGWGRHCPHCGAEHFPRVEPVVIMLAESGDKALLGRQPSWPPGRYSALAGFLEVGEAIEEAVRRETCEESGIRVGAVRYVASQPWPFPASLMVACIGEALNDEIAIDANELEDARWFTRDEVRQALARDPAAPFIAPPPYAIAHTLLTAWAEGA
ncbi:NAD(+) diphosphatase [Sphingomonas kyeonggiensis]|uniref:NAD(+) diphosphatase n=1 Tax=Sphingomonas kyeonggiensis TaxID=1268553 RepID=A0A7W6JWR5_9SPHN|nr:NAD(+) diphosphatase [Sphingomonas kyeonggiensis]MBB4100962.1 NAD+ diphosphatase [Sphingomonas kyeonggiensis]